jgi:phage tail-like protein
VTFAAAKPSNPLPGFRFAVSFSESLAPAGVIAGAGVSHAVAGFSEVSGLDATIEMHDYKEGGRNGFVHKFATRASFANITLRRGVALGTELWDWHERVRRGSFGARRSLLIAHLGEDGEPALVWFVSRALPTKYAGPSFQASQSSVALESIEIAHEGLELLPGSTFQTG